MNPRPIEEAKDPDIRGSMAAIQRAAMRAREIAIQTGTPIVVSRNGVVEWIHPIDETPMEPPQAKPRTHYPRLP